MAFIENNFTITVSALPPFVVKDIGPRAAVPERKHKLDTDYKVANRPFKEYIWRRLEKDGIGFVAKDTYQDSSTDLYSYIAAPIPKNDCDFIAYLHELGHCKSRQHADSRNFYYSTWDGKWGMERLVSEVNAWKWALRYFRRIGLSLTVQTKNVVKVALESYFADASDINLANKLSKDFEEYCGIPTKCPHHHAYLEKKICKPKENFEQNKPNGWKPWHDLKQTQMKRQWKQQR